MDERLLALADVINSACPAGEHSKVTRTLRNSPGPPLPPGKKLLPYLKLRREYEGTWRRAMRKIRIVNMLRRVGEERRRRESEDSIDRISTEEETNPRRVKRRVSQQTEFMVEHLLHKASMQRKSIRSRKPPPYSFSKSSGTEAGTERNKFVNKPGTSASSGARTSADNVQNTAKRGRDSNGPPTHNTVKTIAIQTDRPPADAPPLLKEVKKVKPKKVKKKARSQQVVMADSHLSLAMLRERERKENSGKLKGSKSMSDVRDSKLTKSNAKVPPKLKRSISDSSIDVLSSKVRGQAGKRNRRQAALASTSAVGEAEKARKRSDRKSGRRSPTPKVKPELPKHPDGGILLHQGRVYKPGYSPNLNKREEKPLYNKTGRRSKSPTVRESDLEADGKQRTPTDKQIETAKRSRTRKKSVHSDSAGEEKQAKAKKRVKMEESPIKPAEITDEQRLGEADKEGLVFSETNNDVPNTDGSLKPPGNPELEKLENLFAKNEGDEKPGADDLDPALVVKVEEQIFEKIKFYKDVQSKVKEKTWFLRKKMTLRAEANAYTSRFEGVSSGSGGAGFGARMKVTLHKMSRELSNYAALMVPWEGKIKNIESYFGSVVASYFTFLRWLFWINFVMALICGVVIIMPEVMFGPDMGTVDYKSVPDSEATEASYLKTLWNFNGYAQVSPLFYGYYSSIKRYDSGYRMPFAYLLGNLMMFAYSFITILKQMASNSKNEKATDKDDNFTFSWKAFSSWDYMIGNEETAKNKYKALVIAIRESVTESKESAKKISKRTKFLRFFANVLVFLVLAGSTYAIYETVNRSRKFQAMIKEFGPNAVTWTQSNEVSIVMSLVTTFCPMLFDIIAGMEDYHPRVALQWSLRRIMVLYLLNLYTLYIALYWKIQDIEKEAELANATFYENLNMSAIVPCSPLVLESSEPDASFTNLTIHSTLNTSDVPCGLPEFVPEVTCWETMVGQELIKLTVFDFVTAVALIYITEFFRAVIIKVLNACWCWDMERFFPGYAEFSLADNLLHLVYNQGMIWMGTLFCPGLPALNLVKLLCLFYVRAWAVMVCNVPHERIFKAGSDNFYLMLLLFMLYVVMIPIAFAMVSIRPSRSCGPYRETEYMYLIITEWMKDVFHENIFAVFKYLTSPGALIPIFILLLLCIYYLSNNNDALHGTVLDLKKQLQYERTEGKKRVFNMNKAAEAAAAPPVAPPEVKIKPSSMAESADVEKERSPTITSAILAKKYITLSRKRINERKLASVTVETETGGDGKSSEQKL